MATIAFRSFALNDGSFAALRTLGPQHARAFLEFSGEIFKESRFLFHRRSLPGLDECQAMIEERMKAPRDVLIGAIDMQGHILGTATLAGHDHPVYAHVVDVSTAVREHCRRQGVGTALMTSLLSYATELPGVTRIQLSVASANAAAIRLYDKLGFELEGSKKSACKIEGEYVDENLMAIMLPRAVLAA